MRLQQPTSIGPLLGACVLFSGTLLGIAPPVVAQEAEQSRAIDDRRIESRVEAELGSARAVPSNRIDVSCAEGVVTLTGTVPNLLARDRAERITQMVRGVRGVIDRMQVLPAAKDDAELAQAVEHALARDPATESWEVTVGASNGVVTLEGTMNSHAEKELATKVARSVRGVREVRDGMTIDRYEPRSDEEVRTEIVQRNAWDARIDDSDVRVEVRDGAVTLTGTVRSAYEQELARANAWVEGVRSVDDENLEVDTDVRSALRPRGTLEDATDEQIASAVEAAFRYDPRVLAFELEVTVTEGLVTLRGEVGNLKALRAAEEDARNTLGVRRVRNQLKVRYPESHPADRIEQEIETRIAEDVIVGRYGEVDAVVLAGVAHLYGTVDSYFDRMHAEDVAARVAGVERIRNHLIVDYDAPLSGQRYYGSDWDPVRGTHAADDPNVRGKPDYEIEEDIEEELFWSPFVDAEQIEVDVEDGTAVLTGRVDSWAERRAATENAVEGGARKVRNQLGVDGALGAWEP